MTFTTALAGGGGGRLRGSPQLHSFSRSFAEKHKPCWQEVWQGFLFFLFKERVRWGRLDTADESPGGREGMFERAGRISEAMSLRGGGLQRPQGAVALAGNTDRSQVREGAGSLQRGVVRVAGGVSKGLGLRRETEVPALEANFPNFTNGWRDAGGTTGGHPPRPRRQCPCSLGASGSVTRVTLGR